MKQTRRVEIVPGLLGSRFVHHRHGPNKRALRSRLKLRWPGDKAGVTARTRLNDFAELFAPSGNVAVGRLASPEVGACLRFFGMRGDGAVANLRAVLHQANSGERPAGIFGAKVNRGIVGRRWENFSLCTMYRSSGRGVM